MNLNIGIINKLFKPSSEPELREYYENYLEGGLEIINEFFLEQFRNGAIPKEKKSTVMTEIEELTDVTTAYEIIQKNITEIDRKSFEQKLKDALDIYDQKIISQALNKLNEEDALDVLQYVQADLSINKEVLEDLKNKQKTDNTSVQTQPQQPAVSPSESQTQSATIETATSQNPPQVLDYNNNDKPINPPPVNLSSL